MFEFQATADTDIILPQDMVAISGNCGQYNNGKYSSNLTLTWDNGYFSLSMIFEVSVTHIMISYNLVSSMFMYFLSFFFLVFLFLSIIFV